jgi:hypothetical protein
MIPYKIVKGSKVSVSTEDIVVNYKGMSKKSKRIPSIFNDESTGSCICLKL